MFAVQQMLYVVQKNAHPLFFLIIYMIITIITSAVQLHWQWNVATGYALVG